MSDKDQIVLVVGPTAVGKTDTGIYIAKHLNGEIISADSMQIYRYMDIGSAKPTKQEMEGIRHYLIDEIYPDEEFSVATFQEKAFQYIDEIARHNKTPIIVGGTGLYVNSLVQGMDFTDTISDWELRDRLQSQAEEMGNQYIHNMLKEVDPEMAQKLHPNDLRRIIRALEVYNYSGIKMSTYQRKSKEMPLRYDPIIVGLTMDRQNLYNRINIRVDKMISNGLIDEVKGLLDMGYSKDLISMQGLGYKEIVGFLQGTYSREEAIDILKMNTRRFAKRQLTWFRRDERIRWYNIDEYSSITEMGKNIIEFIEGKLRSR